MAGLLALGLLVFAERARSGEIAGSITDFQNHPVTSAHVSVKDQAGNVVGKADADPDGHYTVGGIATGEYSISLTLPGTNYQGQTIVTGVPPEGLCLYWMVSQSASALATGRPGARDGTCTPVSAAAGGTTGASLPARSLRGGTLCSLVADSFPVSEAPGDRQSSFLPGWCVNRQVRARHELHSIADG